MIYLILLTWLLLVLLLLLKMESNSVKKTDYNTKFTEIEKKIKAISTKGLTKDLIDKFSIVNGAKYFSSGIFQNYLVFIPAIKYIKHFSGTIRVQS